MRLKIIIRVRRRRRMENEESNKGMRVEGIMRMKNERRMRGQHERGNAKGMGGGEVGRWGK